MGEGGYIRIQNKSKHNVKMKVIKGRKVDSRGMNDIQGEIAPGEQLPKNGEKRYGGTYEYIEGDVRFRLQRDGYFHLEAHVDGSSPSGLIIKVDNDNWWTEDPSPDKDSVVNLVADVDEIDGTSKIELRVYDNFNASSWMAELQDSIRDTPLCEVALPGTHDSGTYRFDKEKGASPDSDLTKTIEDKLDKGGIMSNMTDFILKNIFKRLCKCQSKTLKEQMEHGIRYLDLRIAYHEESGTFWTCHGVYCVNMTDVMDQIKQFLDENPKEIVLLDFNHFYGEIENHHKELAALILESLGDKAASFNDVKPNSPVSEYWEKGYQAVVLYHHQPVIQEFEGKLWPRRFIDSPWPETGDAEELHVKLKENIAKKENNPGKFFVLQGILTPDAESIKEEIMESGGVSIESMCRECNSKITDWVETDFQSLNVVIIDFFENCSLLPCVVSSNRKS